MLLDANLLLYAVHEGADRHEPAVAWLTEQLNGSRRVGIPWASLGAFLRIATHPRAFPRPLPPATAWQRVTDWLSAPVAWIPQPGPEHARILGRLVAAHDVRGNLVPDAMLAALAIEHGLTLHSSDTDFARFSDLRWEDPLR
ncbi:MAG TPA: type II toxin-antitoxin system VapC family toxin [Conexibacter sp.]|jgi:toxin-antitoxin system PIN domain toxin|nr:type II toxin-antitoxin system VapC family toxin [Conexibacter sp.]